MKITCHFQPDSSEVDRWIRHFSQLLPDAEVTRWQPGDAPADYAFIWNPSRQFITEQTRLKAMFNAGAGVDAFLKLGLPVSCPLIRLEDAGMGEQMSDYVVQAALHHFRGFDRFQEQQQAALWRQRAPSDKADFPVGVLGFGVLGQRVARDLSAHGFAVHAWARSDRDTIDGIRLFHGEHALGEFLAATRILACLLPLTPETENILNRENLGRLRRGAYVINVARGAHVVDDDLIAAIDEGQIAGATLDVFREEPLPRSHPFWRHPRVRVTPHIAAISLYSDSVRQVVEKIRRIEAGLPVTGVVDTGRGY
ncbi:2-hydroxyacid dehydrogenase [Paracandidimonas soli]|uniref:Glyoxylate/hydroxypyruvate reductase A n=1 Tax=Paracandidimonas soli TaxID=1917182 RepID=A0A4V2VQ46_9BURK|nr:glyoxylate/hydroxypyruvate reductase A [Paracandidimonas soli]TCU93179.1 glyoxylate/hydroxypyruvate reductase A [Paracandidimonas soli]